PMLLLRDRGWHAGPVRTLRPSIQSHHGIGWRPIGATLGGRVPGSGSLAGSAKMENCHNMTTFILEPTTRRWLSSGGTVSPAGPPGPSARPQLERESTG